MLSFKVLLGKALYYSDDAEIAENSLSFNLEMDLKIWSLSYFVANLLNCNNKTKWFIGLQMLYEIKFYLP